MLILMLIVLDIPQIPKIAFFGLTKNFRRDFTIYSSVLDLHLMPHSIFLLLAYSHYSLSSTLSFIHRIYIYWD